MDEVQPWLTHSLGPAGVPAQKWAAPGTGGTHLGKVLRTLASQGNVQESRGGGKGATPLLRAVP